MILELYKGDIADLNVSAIVKFWNNPLTELAGSRKSRAKKQIKASQDDFPSNVLSIADEHSLTSVGAPLEFSVDQEFLRVVSKHPSSNPDTLVLISGDKDIVLTAENDCRRLYRKHTPNLTIILYSTGDMADAGKLLTILDAGCREEHGFGMPPWKAGAVLQNIDRYFVAQTVDGRIIGVHAYSESHPIQYQSHDFSTVNIVGPCMIDGYVIPEFRKSGVFGRINMIIERYAAEQGKSIIYDTTETRERQPTYLKNGYDALGRCMCCPKHEEACSGLVFSKELKR